MKVPVTIVIPVYNRARVVERTLQSVEAQTFRPLRVVLVDNASTDGSLEVLRRWKDTAQAPDLQIDILEEPERGAATARNTGLAVVESEWTMFFDSDDSMRPDHVESAIGVVESEGDVDVVGWDVMEHGFKGEKTVRHFSTDDMLYDCVMHGSFATLRYFARTELFRRAGGWNPSMKIWDDVELGVRILELEPKVAYRRGTPKVDVYMSEESLSGPTFSSRATVSENAIDEIERLLPAGYEYIAGLKRAILAAHYCREGIIDPVPLLTRALHATPSLWHRLLLRCAYFITVLRIRGAARLLRVFF